VQQTVPKRLSDTRWDAHANATSAVSEGYNGITDALESLHDDDTEKGDTRREAGIINDKMQEFEFVLMLEFWNDVLTRFQQTSKTLQESQVAISTCATLYTSLVGYLNEVREKYNEFERRAKERLPDVDYKGVTARKATRRRQVNDGVAEEVILSPREKFRLKAFLPIIDALVTNLTRRADVYQKVAKDFDFITQFDLMHGERDDKSRYLIAMYPEDINESFVGELAQFQAYVKSKNTNYTLPVNNVNKKFSHQDLYTIIFVDGIQSAFPNVEVVLRIFLSLMVTNCSGERSFSHLKRIKNDIRATMLQDRLSSLSIMCIESDKLREIKFENIIESFANRKSRKHIL
jgi:hypothetical protein